MQKLKKALKKLTAFGASKNASQSGKKPAQAAKKASPVKRKSQAVGGGKKAAPAKKAAPKKPAAKAVAGKSSGKGAKPESKVDSKLDAKKKSAQPAKPAPAKAVEKAVAKPASDKQVEKQAKGAKKPVPTAAAPAPAKAPAPKAGKVAKKKEEPTRAEAAPADEEIVLTDADGRRYCRVKDCDQAATVDSYCRYHYLLFWKNIQNRKKILSEGKLERYIEELTARYPDKYLELLRKDLRSEKDFMAAIQELEIDDTSVENEFEDEAQSYLDEVRGMSTEPTAEREEDF